MPSTVKSKAGPPAVIGFGLRPNIVGMGAACAVLLTKEAIPANASDTRNERAC